MCALYFIKKVLCKGDLNENQYNLGFITVYIEHTGIDWKNAVLVLLLIELPTVVRNYIHGMIMSLQTIYHADYHSALTMQARL